MQVRCVAEYSSGAGTYLPSSDVIHVSDEIGAFLLRDSPGSFERVDVPEPVVAEERTIADAPDRMQRGGRTR